jgi:eukaryotic-like serine/threonine-protein kinase
MSLSCGPSPLHLGPYELLKKLATGGMAEIYVARRVGPHGFSKRIALKRILPQLAADPEFVAMFIDEARLCAQLAHPNLVQVFDFGEDGGELYMAMELVEGTTAAKAVRTAAARGEPVPMEAALHVAVSVGRGLEFAHQACDENGKPMGLVHRDVSPGNILISRSGAVKLGDFGIARAAEFDRRTQDGQLKGKLGYMSPEQATGKELDAKSDQFAIGIVLSELLTGHPLFSGSEMEVLIKIRDADLSVLDQKGQHIPQDVRAVLFRLLARRPDDRYPTMSEFLAALEEIIRRRRLGVGPNVLVEWLVRVGLTEATGRSGEHLISDLPDTQPRGANAQPAAVVSPLAAEQGRRASQPPIRRGRPAGSQSLPPGNVAPAIYRAILADGTVIGPVPLPRMAELFATGSIFANTPVSKEGKSLHPARSFPELERLCSTLATRWDAEVDSRAKRRWPIREGEWPGELFDLVIARSTGLLVARDGAHQKKVFFVDGVPEFTASTEPSEFLGAFLVARGLALPMEVEMALALAPSYGGRLGDALVGLGVLRPMELAKAVVEQIRKRFVELVRWEQGEAAYVDGARAYEDESLPEAFAPVDLLVRGITNGYPPERIAAVLKPMLGAPVMAAPKAAVSAASLRLSPREEAVLVSLGAAKKVGDIIDDCVAKGVADKVEAARAIFVGLSSRMLVSPVWPPAEVASDGPTLRRV